MIDSPDVQFALARESDTEDLVRLEARLFAEDAGIHDPDVDVSWPDRNGRDDFARLLASDSAVVLVARNGTELLGHLVGYLSDPSPTRHGRRSAQIRSLYVDESHRGAGVGHALVERFLTWASDREAHSVGVTSYLGNTGARSFYCRLGFAERSVVLHRPLDARVQSHSPVGPRP